MPLFLFCHVQYFRCNGDNDNGSNVNGVSASEFKSNLILSFLITAFFQTNMNDVVPPFAAVGMSIGNTFASIMGFVAPAIAGSLLKSYGQTVFVGINSLTFSATHLLFGTQFG